MSMQQQNDLSKLSASLLAEVMERLADSSWRDEYPDAFEELWHYLPSLRDALADQLMDQLKRSLTNGEAETDSPAAKTVLGGGVL